MMYDEILSEAVRAVVRDLDAGQIRLDTEEDLRGFLFHECVKFLLAKDHSIPIPVHAEVDFDGWWPDLVLGPRRDTVVELKFEPFATRNGTVDHEAIKHDIEKLNEYAEGGGTGHFIMIECEGKDLRQDEDWWWPEHASDLGIPKRRWEEATKSKKFVWVHHLVHAGN